MGEDLSGHHADRIQAAIASDAAAKSALVASWRRSSSLHRLDPTERSPPTQLTEAELDRARQRIEPLIRAAQSSLDRLYLAVGGVGCCVLLADRNGVPVERRGAPADDETFQSWGLWTGSVWNEESEGTNGIGTCLVEQRALTIHRDQHFHTRNTALSCTTAPIYDHEGNLVAALDVSSCRADLTEAFANLISLAVVDAARRIEAENFRMAFPKARILLAPVADKGSGALIAVDADDLVVGATRVGAPGAWHYATRPRQADARRGSARRAAEGRRRSRRGGARRSAARAGARGWQCLGRGAGAWHQPRDASPQARPPRISTRPH